MLIRIGGGGRGGGGGQNGSGGAVGGGGGCSADARFLASATVIIQKLTGDNRQDTSKISVRYRLGLVIIRLDSG